MSDEGTRDFFRLLAGYVVPPLGVGLQEGINSVFWTNVVLTLLCWVPGQVHAAYVITGRDEGGTVSEGGTTKFVALLASYFVPPVGVFLTKGVGTPLFINIVLTLLFLFPGAIHAIWLIANDD